MTADDIRSLSDEEARTRVEEIKEELFRLRFRATTTELENPMLLRALKRDVSRLNTVLHERTRRDTVQGTAE